MKTITTTDLDPFDQFLGENVLIRTVTHYQVGRLVAVAPTELILEDASWVADTGRFHDALQNGTFAESEPWPAGPVIVGRGAIVDACIWAHDLPTTAI